MVGSCLLPAASFRAHGQVRGIDVWLVMIPSIARLHSASQASTVAATAASAGLSQPGGGGGGGEVDATATAMIRTHLLKEETSGVPPSIPTILRNHVNIETVWGGCSACRGLNGSRGTGSARETGSPACVSVSCVCEHARAWIKVYWRTISVFPDRPAQHLRPFPTLPLSFLLLGQFVQPMCNKSYTQESKMTSVQYNSLV